MADTLLPILNTYSNFAMTADGVPEINSLRYMPFERDFLEFATGSRVVIVLVEPRLTEAGGNTELQNQLIRALIRYKADLRAEGLFSRFILADVYKGPIHKDGQTVLAIRHFFKAVKASFVNFEGAVLIGNFPEATLVRKVCWAQSGKLAIATELISERAEIVLADLNGNWENLYRRTDFSEELISARADAATDLRGWRSGESVVSCEFTSSDFEVRNTGANAGPFRDAFFLNDAIYTILEQRTSPSRFLKLRINSGERNNEVAADDRSSANIIAKPEIAVSRINPYHIAMNPNPSLAGTDGHHFLDASGNPQTVSSPTRLIGDTYSGMFTMKDFNLERKILISYFKRNHKFRIGSYSKFPFRTAAISGTTDFIPNDFTTMLNRAATDFSAAVNVPNANLNQYVQFLKTPAVLKYIIAHSDAFISEFNPFTNTTDYTNECGGLPFRWIYTAGGHRPTFEGLGRAADIFTHRALWHYGTLNNFGAGIIIHGGCGVNSIVQTQSSTYTDVSYGASSNSEGLLFFGNCIALFSRAKVFNDKPDGFAEGFRLNNRANLGSCWKSYFNALASDASLTTNNIQRKRSYFWSLNGDWSVRLKNTNGLGLIGFGGALESIDVHPNRAWIDGWNFDSSVNRIRGIADVDGDGIDEIMISSEWGIGILKYNGSHFTALLAAPRDTWFGAWRYDATINAGRDLIKATGKYTQDLKQEVLIWSSWGIATLIYNNGTFSTSRIFSNGTRLGGWLLNTADNTFAGTGNFDRDSRKDLVLMSPWGLGIISLNNSNHICMAQNGSRFGGWLFNSRDNQIKLMDDFDGDGLDEILITGPSGIGILKVVSGALSLVAMFANGTNLGGYMVSHTDNFCMSGKFKGTATSGMMVASRQGLHYLELNGTALSQSASVANGSRVDGWVIDTATNKLQAAGDMNGDNRAEFLVRSAWGTGLFQISAANQFRCLTLVANDSMLNDWHLQTTDVVLGHGKLNGGASNRTSLLMIK